MNKNKKNRKGFTIVELVIVIAVIGILATVLVPTFGDVIGKANVSAAVQEAKNSYTQYVSDFDYSNGNSPAEYAVVQGKSSYFVVIDGQMSTTPYTSAADAAKQFPNTQGENPTHTATAGEAVGNVTPYTYAKKTA